MHKLTESILDKFSMDYLRNQVLKNAYGNDDTVIAGLDPRVLLVWYLFFGLVPWFLNDLVILLGLFIFVALTTRAAKIAPLVLFLFCLGVFSQTGYLLIAALFFGGDASTVAPLLVMTLKVAVVSLASITVFSGLDPDRLANGMLWFGCPDQLSFSISFAYRILPVLMEEFQNILLSYRLRGNPPAKKTFPGKIRYLFYQIKLIIQAFYPLMLNTAKRSRTTVEALEIKGYRYALKNPTVKKMKLAMLKVTRNDGIFAAVSIVWTVLCVLVSAVSPL
ncbi:energy-coupling factor transporter transmembrane component T family protein [Mordavella massiliensis]|jgi:energy-coupling factor transport system permease protein|uniref:Energy-coupling factor transporter transmembrane protein EcfT n=1 Tax=Mordavella massiliensis TaxID=1871024 RepID=A0A938X1Y3_9CLOT|nr:energy-coupling factor transporter transmembrane component T [Mordavella massiliensis]MBM6827085.1 energy-coupling factor transporter transmembrane protein EcfT [Mordavella massiliensis]MBM6969469.1 energy-coupling factor transporter transmembrane protein EcfT [Mordavella massiliensis]HJB86590.1 energy-coupling factor transporter transmembrane protein EcfT [Candidatus Dorea faecigallinarum]